MLHKKITSEDILKAISAKHYDGALARELVLNVNHSGGKYNRWQLDRMTRFYGKNHARYHAFVESISGQEIDPEGTVPREWSPPSNRRIDGFLYSKKKLIAIEVKVSVADFKRETPEKREPWERVSHQFIYATPKGLLLPSDIPPQCGLWEVDEFNRVTIAKKAKVNKNLEPMPQQVLVSLMYRDAKRR